MGSTVNDQFGAKSVDAFMISHVRVLVVDDDSVITDLLRVHLERQGYTVTVASNAAEGLKRIAEERYHLVVSDVEMAEMNGIEFLQRIREEQPAIGVIIMTGFPENHPRIMATRAGADGYIPKPFSLTQFSTALERAYWNALTRADDLDFDREEAL